LSFPASSPRARWPELAHGIYAIVDTALVADPVPFARALLAGGVRVVQLRAKSGVDRAHLRGLLEAAHDCGGLVLVNDDIEAARLADGVHLGQEDAELLDLRALRTEFAEKVIGLSCGVPDEATRANPLGLDYYGVGPFFSTSTKGDAGAPIGARGVNAVVGASSVPIVAIGGITGPRLAEVRASGAAMAAMISALCTPEPETTARELVAAWNGA
jgi:thiamine-phosphate pyrophosphorylase